MFSSSESVLSPLIQQHISIEKSCNSILKPFSSFVSDLIIKFFAKLRGPISSEGSDISSVSGVLLSLCIFLDQNCQFLVLRVGFLVHTAADSYRN